jgi:hypothetical protein
VQDDKKFKKLKVILILIFIFLCIPVTLLYLFLRDVSVLSFFFNNYIGSGNSFFIPFLPKINLLWYLPKPFSMISFSLGHLIDIIILINIIGYLQSSIYHYFVKKVYLNEYSQVLMYLNFDSLGSKEQTYFSAQDSECLFNFYESLNYPLNINDFQIETEGIYQPIEKVSRFHFNKTFKDKIFSTNFKFTLNKCNTTFGNPSILLFLKHFRIFHLVINYYVKNCLILTDIFKRRRVNN